MNQRRSVSLVINGFAVAQRAPQGAIIPPLPPALRKRHHVVMHSPAEVRKWQIWARKTASDQMDGQHPMKGMLEVAVQIYLPVPKSMPKKYIGHALEGRIQPITRPDLDNYSKAILDSLTGICWLDDSQIVSLSLRKLYSEKPRIEIQIEELVFPKPPSNTSREMFPR
jgi:Holliday junction resolvase RusA-like endonuclease